MRHRKLFRMQNTVMCERNIFSSCRIFGEALRRSRFHSSIRRCPQMHEPYLPVLIFVCVFYPMPHSPHSIYPTSVYDLAKRNNLRTYLTAANKTEAKRIWIYQPHCGEPKERFRRYLYRIFVFSENRRFERNNRTKIFAHLHEAVEYFEHANAGLELERLIDADHCINYVRYRYSKTCTLSRCRLQRFL